MKQFGSSIAPARQWVLDAVFPQICVRCERLGSVVCVECFKLIRPAQHKTCLRCKKPSSQQSWCQPCLTESPLESLHTLADYDQPILQALVKLWKYQYVREAGEALQQFLLSGIANYPLTVDCVVPIPLHAQRLRTRGFNQSAKLADALSERHKIPVAHALIRKSATRPQAKLSLKERQVNVSGAFVAKMRLDGQRVLILDDVVTTGATMEQAARTLRAAGALSVHGVAIAEG